MGWKKLKENKWEGKERQVEVEEQNRVENSGKNKEEGGLRASGSGSEGRLSWSERRRGFGRGKGERDTVKC